MQKEMLKDNVISSNNKLLSTVSNNNSISSNITMSSSNKLLSTDTLNKNITMISNNKLILKNNKISQHNTPILNQLMKNNNVLKNNHNNIYEPNIIYTSTQYLIDTDPYLIRDEKAVMQLNKDLCNPKSQNSIVFNFSIKQSINNILANNRKTIFMDEFRNIVDELIKCNIGELPERADEVKNFNKTLTKITLNALLNKIIGNNINTKEHNILLLNNKDEDINSIFGKFNNDIKDLGIMKYKNKQCSFKITNNYNALYYTVSLK